MVHRLIHVCALIALLTLSLPLSAVAQDTLPGIGRADKSVADLGAMMLTPRDLEDEGLEGYGIRNAWTDTLDDELLGLLEGDFTAEEIEETLDTAGYVRTLATTYDLPSEEDPSSAARRVMIFLDEYTGDENLADALDIFLAFPDAEALDGNEAIGDESRIVTYEELTDDGVVATTWVVLAFAVGNLTAQVLVGDYAGYLPDDEPTVEEVEALGLRLLERIETVQDEGSPGLNGKILRLESDGDAVAYIEDHYSRLAGDSLALYGEDVTVTEQRGDEDDEAGVVDTYSLDQWIGGGGIVAMEWIVRLWTFEDEDAASSWLADSVASAEDDADVIDFELGDEPDLGDEAATFVYGISDANADNRIFYWSESIVRVGSEVARISLGRYDEPAPAAIVEELVAAQLDCMDSGDCTTEAPAPDGLLALAADDIADATVDTGGVGNDSGQPSEDDLLNRVETFDDLSTDHVEGPVDYEQIPPVGGEHNGLPQNCGFYDEPIGSEHAVHSLEHGAVWVTYDPELSRADVRVLQALADEHDYLLVSPFEGLPAPVVASAWGVQLQLDGVDDPYLVAFIDYYEQGPQTPEPGASCSGTTETMSFAD